MKAIRYKLKRWFPFAARDVFLTASILIAASLLCAFLKTFSTTDFHVPLIFVLAVFLISLLTNGYAFGIIASIIAVFGVNYVFTYPYYAFNFTMTGYPITILCSFAVSIITCTLTTRVRQSESIRMEGEREKLRANLLRAVSHDFRTPLTSIIGSINAILENDETLTRSEKISLLSDAKTDAEWLINMVENLLSITRIDAGFGVPLHTELQAVEEIIGESVNKFRRQYPGMPLEIHIPDALLLVPMDATLMEQVILNLLINACIHGETLTHITLEVRKEDDHAVFLVSDDGIGIAADLLPQLFELSGYKSAQHPNDKTKNMGIGLMVCNAIVSAHGGTMHAKNLRGGGACVGFSLPLANTDLAEQTQAMEMEAQFYGD